MNYLKKYREEKINQHEQEKECFYKLKNERETFLNNIIKNLKNNNNLKKNKKKD